MRIWLSVLLMIVVIYSVRMLPMLLLRKDIKNVRIRSFLYYVPYVTLAVMTFPAIIQATKSPVSGIAALLVGLVAAWFRGDLFFVAVCCCVSAFLTGLL